MTVSNTSSSTTAITRTTEQEKEALAHSFCIEIFQKGRFFLADEILTPDFVLHNPILPLELTKSGPEGVKRFALFVAECAPGYHVVHDDTISKGDKVMIRWTFTGVIKKRMLGISPSSKSVTITGIDLFRITTDGKIAELWQQFNVGSWR
jgi:predicted SnoaL-like aldol condensation-catalyzing enzyme